MSGIEERITRLLKAHIAFNDAVDEVGDELVLMYQCECQPSLTNEYKTADEWAAHVAAVLVADLGLREEEGADFTGGGLVRYVTEWQEQS